MYLPFTFKFSYWSVRAQMYTFFLFILCFYFFFSPHFCISWMIFVILCWYIYCLNENLCIAFVNVFFIMLYIHNLWQFSDISPILVNYRNLTSFYVPLPFPVNYIIILIIIYSLYIYNYISVIFLQLSNIIQKIQEKKGTVLYSLIFLLIVVLPFFLPRYLLL